MTSRTAFLLGALIAETGVVLALGRAFRTSSAMTQELANRLVNHRCPSQYPPQMFEAKPPASLFTALVDPPMTDPALARSPITLGRS